METFTYLENRAYCEDLPLRKIAERYATPTFVYSKSALISRARAFRSAFAGYPTLACYAVKANSNLTILGVLVHEGLGADIVSGGELGRALRAGCPANQIVYSGVGKTENEIVDALHAGILAFNVESAQEISQLQSIAARTGKKAPISLRINPNIEVKTHPHIATGLYRTKFGISEESVRSLIPALKSATHLELVGIGCHIGSQLLDLGPYEQAARRMAELSQDFRAEGFQLRHLDLGGGYGVCYDREQPTPLKDIAEVMISHVRPTGLSLVLEPGRVIVANAGVLLTKVLLTKQTPEKKFVVVDAAMNDLIRPALYEAHHTVCPETKSDASAERVDIVGPICESGDFLAQDRELPPVDSGDYLFVRSAGAYGMSMASNYNSRPRAAEVLVDRDFVSLVRRRETFHDLIAAEEGI